MRAARGWRSGEEGAACPPARRRCAALLALLGAAGLRLAAQDSCRVFVGAGSRQPVRLGHRLAEHTAAAAAATDGLRDALLEKSEPSKSALGLPPLKDRVFLVTGATNGIGRATVEMLAREGATVLVHGRDEGRIMHTMDKLMRTYRNATLDGYEADFASMEDVREMAQLIRERHPVIHGILHNAATMDGDYHGEKMITWEQEEHTLAVNTLAPFVLTAELLPQLQASGAGRVIFSGSATMGGGMYIDDLDFERKWSGNHAYAVSKLAGAMMTEEMHQRYGDAPRLTFGSIDPGTADTKLARHGASWARGHRKGRSQNRLVYGTLPNAKTAKASFKALTEDAFQEKSGFRLDTANGAMEIDDEEMRNFVWDELIYRTKAEWPMPPKLLEEPEPAGEEQVAEEPLSA